VRTAGPALVLILAVWPVWAKDSGPSSKLLDAAARGNGSRLTALLAAGADPDARDAEGRPALLLAVASGQSSAVRSLLQGGARPDAATRSGWTPLHEAAAAGRLEAARELIDGGAELDLLDRARGTPLDVAEQAGHERVARLVRTQGARGSGKSVGDTVCVRPWGGEGYCGVVVARDARRHKLRVTGVVGCVSGCEARAECSAGRSVGPGGLSEEDTLWIPTSCLTHTGLR